MGKDEFALHLCQSQAKRHPDYHFSDFKRTKKGNYIPKVRFRLRLVNTGKFCTHVSWSCIILPALAHSSPCYFNDLFPIACTSLHRCRKWVQIPEEPTWLENPLSTCTVTASCVLTILRMHSSWTRPAEITLSGMLFQLCLLSQTHHPSVSSTWQPPAESSQTLSIKAEKLSQLPEMPKLYMVSWHGYKTYCCLFSFSY